MGDQKLRIGLLLVDDAEYLGEGKGLWHYFVARFSSVSDVLQLLPIDAINGSLFTESELNNYDGFMITGANYTVNDGFPWIERTMAFIRLIYRLNTHPLYGMCFGHQLMAKAFGGTVGKNTCGHLVFNNQTTYIDEKLRAREFYKRVFGNREAIWLYEAHGENVLTLPTQKSMAESLESDLVSEGLRPVHICKQEANSTKKSRRVSIMNLSVEAQVQKDVVRDRTRKLSVMDLQLVVDMSELNEKRSSLPTVREARGTSNANRRLKSSLSEDSAEVTKVSSVAPRRRRKNARVGDDQIACEVLAWSDTCTYEMLSYSDKMMSSQGHPEFEKTLMTDILVPLLMEHNLLSEEDSVECVETFTDIDCEDTIKFIASFFKESRKI